MDTRNIPSVHSLADFKRFLKLPGATVQVVRNDWSDPVKQSHPIKPKPGYWDKKTVDKVLSSSVKFSTGSYLTFPKAADCRFAGDTVTIDLNPTTKFTDVLVYQLTIENQEDK